MRIAATLDVFIITGKDVGIQVNGKETLWTY